MIDAVVIGYGVIGQAVAEAFGIDKYYSRSSSNITLQEAARCQYIFICLPTPTLDGKCYTEDIEDLVKKLYNNGLSSDSVLIIRSTVPPGFNRYLQERFQLSNIVSNPEFINNDTAIEDMQNPDLIVIGADDSRYLEMVHALYKGRFKYIEPLLTDSVTAELIKYSLNMFFATKVVFANELYDYTQRVNANYSVIRKVLETHRWGSKNHFDVFHKGGRGAGGKCLRKDLLAFSNAIGGELFPVLMRENEQLLAFSGKELSE